MDLPTSFENDLYQSLPQAPLMPRYNRLRPLVRPLARLPTRNDTLHPAPLSATIDPVMALHQLNSKVALKESSFLPVLRPRDEEPSDHSTPSDLRTKDNGASIITSRRSPCSTGESLFSSSSSPEDHHPPIQPEVSNNFKLPMMRPKKIRRLEVTHPRGSPKLVTQTELKESAPSTPVNNITSSIQEGPPKTPAPSSWSVVSLSPPSLVQSSYYVDTRIVLEDENLPLDIMLPTF